MHLYLQLTNCNINFRFLNRLSINQYKLIIMKNRAFQFNTLQVPHQNIKNKQTKSGGWTTRVGTTLISPEPQLPESCDINIKQFMKRDPKREQSIVEQINSIYLRKDFSDMKFDLKDSLSNNGLIDSNALAQNQEKLEQMKANQKKKGYEKPLRRANQEISKNQKKEIEFNDDKIWKRAKQKRIKSGNPMLRHTRENNLILFANPMSKNEKKKDFINKMVARSYLQEIKNLALSNEEKGLRLHEAKEQLRDQIGSRLGRGQDNSSQQEDSNSESESKKVKKKVQVLETALKEQITENVDGFKNKLEPTSSEAQASSKALFLKYRSNAINTLRLNIIENNTKHFRRHTQTLGNQDLQIGTTYNMEIIENQMFDEDKSQMSTLRSQNHVIQTGSEDNPNMTTLGSQTGLFTIGNLKSSDVRQTIEVEDQSIAHHNRNARTQPHTFKPSLNESQRNEIFFGSSSNKGDSTTKFASNVSLNKAIQFKHVPRKILKIESAAQLHRFAKERGINSSTHHQRVVSESITLEPKTLGIKPRIVNKEGGHSRLQSAVIRESKRGSAIIQKQRPYTGAVRGNKVASSVFKMQTLSSNQQSKVGDLNQKEMLFEIAKSSTIGDESKSTQFRNTGLQFQNYKDEIIEDQQSSKDTQLDKVQEGNFTQRVQNLQLINQTTSGIFSAKVQQNILDNEQAKKDIKEQINAQQTIWNLFYNGVIPKSQHHMSSHTIKIQNSNKQDFEQTLETEVIESIYKERCTDCGLNFKSMGPQFDKFKQYAAKFCVNRKIVLYDQALSINCAKYFVQILMQYSMNIAIIEIGKNFLRDPGIIELSKGLKYTKCLVSLDVCSNEISPKGILALTQSISQNESLASLNLSTVDGIQRNRLSKEGGQYIADYLISSERSMVQIFNLNNTSLGDKGLNFILNAINVVIKRDLNDNKFQCELLEKQKLIQGNVMQLTKTMMKAKNTLLNSIVVKTIDGENSGTATPHTQIDKNSMENPYDPWRTEKLLSEADDGTMGSLIQNIQDEKFKSTCIVQTLQLQRNDIKFSESTNMNLNNTLKYGNLTMLDISFNNLGDMGIQQLSIGLVGKITLQKLYLVDCKFGQPGAQEFFANIGINASIQDLKVDQNRIGYIEVQNDVPQYITSFRDFFSVNQCLRSLSMSQCGFDDTALQKFCFGLAINSTLKDLNLRDNEFGDEGAIELANAFSKGKNKISHLYLNDNKIADSGAKALAYAIRNLKNNQRTLKGLDLNNNSIGADGAFYLGEQLRFNPQLTRMSLNLNISIPHSLLLQIKQQLAYNKLFQQIHKMPNMIAEREFLRKATDPANFKKIEKVHNKAKAKFMENKHECQTERRKAAAQKKEMFKIRIKAKKEQREVQKIFDGIGEQIKEKEFRFNKISARQNDEIYKIMTDIRVLSKENDSRIDDLNKCKKHLKSKKEEYKNKLYLEVPKQEQKIEFVRLKEAKNRYEEQVKRMEDYKRDQDNIKSSNIRLQEYEIRKAQQQQLDRVMQSSRRSNGRDESSRKKKESAKKSKSKSRKRRNGILKISKKNKKKVMQGDDDNSEEGRSSDDDDSLEREMPNQEKMIKFQIESSSQDNDSDSDISGSSAFTVEDTGSGEESEMRSKNKNRGTSKNMKGLKKLDFKNKSNAESDAMGVSYGASKGSRGRTINFQTHEENKEGDVKKGKKKLAKSKNKKK